jgi:hypothetical protein
MGATSEWTQPSESIGPPQMHFEYLSDPTYNGRS